MGIYAHRFYFKQGLPKFKTIKEKFQEITGLNVQFYSIIHMEELITDSDDILYHLNKKREESNISSINAPYFSCSGFNHVYLDYMNNDNKTFYLEFGIGKTSKYFYQAMIKTMLEIGGQTYTNHIAPDEEENDAFIEPFLETYHAHESFWKRVKPWDKMSQFEKDYFN
ncbi:MAG: hypothetical protein ACRBFS_21310 [Aureispira sp.]